MDLSRLPELVARKRELIVLTTHHDDARIRHRAHLLLLVTEVKSLRTVHSRRGCGSKNLSKWMHRFLDQGADGLQDGPRCGQPRVLDEADAAFLVDMLEHHSPKSRDMLLPSGVWRTCAICSFSSVGSPSATPPCPGPWRDSGFGTVVQSAI